MKFSTLLQSSMNEAKTGNGATTYRNTENPNLDLFYKAGGYRSNDYYVDQSVSDADYVVMFKRALQQDANLAIRNLLNIRDFRHDGKGERKLFRVLLTSLADSYTANGNGYNPYFVGLVLTGAIQELGRWDDLVYAYAHTTSNTSKAVVVDAISSELGKIVYEGKKSLLPKWLPTNTRNKEVYATAKKLAKDLGYSNYSEYRKAVSILRKPLNLIETNLTSKNYDAIEIAHIPSRAFKKYQTALFTHKETDMKSFLDDVTFGKKKVKVTGLTPNEIIKPYTEDSEWSYAEPKTDANQDAVIEAQWKAMVDASPELDNTLVMADVSGSMYGTPITVSVSLAILFAQAAKGAFKNKFMVFSTDPNFVDIPEKATLKEAVSCVMNAKWTYGSTDIDKAFKKVLRVAVDNDVAQEDMPKRIVIISDMQFNSSYEPGVKEMPHIKAWKAKFEEHGYKLPDLVYWNVSSYDNAPATQYEQDVALVSGFTPNTIKAVIESEDFTPDAVMRRALSKPEYDVADIVTK